MAGEDVPTRQPEIRATDVISRDLRGTPGCRQPSELWRRVIGLPKESVSDERKRAGKETEKGLRLFQRGKVNRCGEQYKEPEKDGQ